MQLNRAVALSPRISWSAAGLFFFLTPVLLAVPERRGVIIDQDAFGPGGSDMQSILMLVQSQDADVLGITIESGDGWQKENAAHTLRLLELVGRAEIPVVPGATFPLLNSEEETKRWEKLYGLLPYKGAWMEKWPAYSTIPHPPFHGPDVIPPLTEGVPATRPANELAANFLIRTVRNHPGQISILAMGPLTNLALAIRLDPEFAAWAKELVIMGGSFNPAPGGTDEFSLQFVNNPRVEFNIRWDPEAAKITLHAPWRRVVEVPLDATTATQLTPELAKKVANAGVPAARYVGRFGQIGFPMWDEVAAGIWLEPQLIKRSDQLDVDVDIGHGPNYGAILSWPVGGGPGLGEHTITVVRAIDVNGLNRLFVDLMSRPPRSSSAH